jgi:predicted TIM-barrel fold metal-dependent hydrolase
MPPSPRRKAPIYAAIGLLLAAGAAIAAVLATGDGEARPDPAAGPAAAPAASDIPKIDVHVHFGLAMDEQMLEIMDAHGIRIALNASGGAPGSGLERSAEIARRTDGRLRPYCNLSFGRVFAEGFDAYTRETLSQCKRLGAVGLKIFKSLGLGIASPTGALLAVDDPRLDVVFETASELGLPVLIHTGDPQAFFRPATEDNERYAELRAHPSWSFYGERPDGTGRWPSWEEVFGQYERRVARHPETQFVGAHFGNVPEDPRRIGRMLDRYPNLYVETGARVPEIGRHPPEVLRDLFERHPDRILFGTDIQVTEGGLALGSAGEDPDPPSRIPEFFGAHFRYFETDARGIDHPTPIQGDWTIDGLGLSREALENLYFRNAARLFGLPVE